MGRWGTGIYQGDAARDYFETIIDRIQQSLIVQFSLDLSLPFGGWVVRTLNIIEMTLLLHQHYEFYNFYAIRLDSVRSWQDSFLSVWDSELIGASPRYDVEYRKEKRSIVVKMFSQLQSMIKLRDQPDFEEIDFTSLVTPFSTSSISRFLDQNNNEFIYVDSFVWDLIEQLVKDIIYRLSSERRSELIALFWDFADIVIAADVLTCICEAYQTSPTVSSEVVHGWRELYLQIMAQVYQNNQHDIDASDGKFKQVVAVFDHLETVAKKYPRYEWW